MFSSTAFWISLAGVVFLVLGFILYRRDFASARGLGRLVILGPIFVAAALAAFGAEHFRLGRAMAEGVPAWMPWHVFWVYFVGSALFAAALSFVFRRGLRWSAPLLALMFFIFVFAMDLPATLAQPANRIDWVLFLRETAFACGALAFTGSLFRQKSLVAIARVVLGGVLVFYGVEHFLHPECVIGVPLEKITPAWIPIHAFWAYVAGAIELVTGIALVINKRARFSAAVAGALNTALVLFFYLPILATDRGPAQTVEGVNYVFDTLLFAGTLLLLAGAVGRKAEE